jgi:geranylgeranyl diphosphate synthase, type III
MSTDETDRVVLSSSASLLTGSRELRVFSDESFVDELLRGEGFQLPDGSGPVPVPEAVPRAGASGPKRAGDDASSGTGEEETQDVSRELEGAVLEPLRYQAHVNKTARSGDRFINLLIAAFSRSPKPRDASPTSTEEPSAADSSAWIECSTQVRALVRRVCLELYVACCMLEDISSGAETRRGLPCASMIYGVPLTLNCANQGYFLAMRHCVELDEIFEREEAERERQNTGNVRGGPSAIEIFTEELLRMHVGQGQDIKWRDGHTCPSEDEYMAMLEERAGAIPRLAVRLLQRHSAEPKWATADLMPLTNAISLFLAVSDDYSSFARAGPGRLPASGTVELSDFRVSNESAAVALAEAGVGVQLENIIRPVMEVPGSNGNLHAIVEGRYTLPSVHCIRLARPEDRRLSNILALKADATTSKLLTYAVSFLEETGSLEYTQQHALRLAEAVRRATEALGGNPVLSQVVDEVVERRLSE